MAAEIFDGNHRPQNPYGPLKIPKKEHNFDLSYKIPQVLTSITDLTEKKVKARKFRHIAAELEKEIELPLELRVYMLHYLQSVIAFLEQP